MANYRFNAISIKIPKVFFVELEHVILKFVQKQKRLIVKVILRKRNRVEGSCSLTSDHTVNTKLQKLKQYATGTKPHGSMEQNSPEINPHTYG